MATAETRGRADRQIDLVRSIDPAARARAFRKARRHSFHVRFLKLVLPVVAVASLGLYGLSLKRTFSIDIGKGRASVESITITSENLAMENPKYEGFNSDGSRYLVTARKAVQDFKNKDLVKLEGIDGTLHQVNAIQTNLKSDRGLFDMKAHRLDLADNIEVVSTNGSRAWLRTATVFVKEHHIVSNEPVRVEGAGGTIVAQRLDLLTHERRATFIDDVKVHIDRATSTKSGEPQKGVLAGSKGGPIDIAAPLLVVDDKAKTAHFTGGVVAVQVDNRMSSRELLVVYEGDTEDGGNKKRKAGEAKDGQPREGEGEKPARRRRGEPGEQTRIKSLHGKDDVVLISGGNRQAKGERVDFDALTEVVILTGKVVLTQERNILRGERLRSDRKGGTTRLETPGGRIWALLHPREGQGQGQGKAKPERKKAPETTTATGTPTGVINISRNPNAPVEIDADTLDVTEAKNIAVFRGNVKAVQAGSTIHTSELTVFYEGKTGLGPDAGGPGESARLSKIRATGKVLLTSQDGQSVTGDWAEFDQKTNFMTVGGNVVVTQGENIVRGDKLLVDLNTGQYQVETSTRTPVAGTQPPSAPGDSARSCPPGKICALFHPKDMQDRNKAEKEKQKQKGWSPSVSSSPAERPGRAAQ